MHKAHQEQDLQSQERLEDETTMYLEGDQLNAETSCPVPPAALTTRARVGLWALRVFVIVVSVMVIYVFIVDLH